MFAGSSGSPGKVRPMASATPLLKDDKARGFGYASRQSKCLKAGKAAMVKDC